MALEPPYHMDANLETALPYMPRIVTPFCPSRMNSWAAGADCSRVGRSGMARALYCHSGEKFLPAFHAPRAKLIPPRDC